MSHSKLKIEFHPRKLSRNGSREKFSPYRSKEKRIQIQSPMQENRQKLELNQPLIKFRRLIDPNTSKKRLKLNIEGEKICRQEITPAKYSAQQKQMATHSICNNCMKLMAKIDEQTDLLKENLKEISRNTKLPRIGEKEETRLAAERPNEYEENQKIIINYLDQLRNRRHDNSTFQDLKNAYEQELSSIRKEVSEWQFKYKCLELQLALNKTVEIPKPESASLPSPKKFIDASTSSKVIETVNEQLEVKIDQFEDLNEKTTTPSSKDSMKFLLADIMEKHSNDFQKIINELQQVKLENQMLREEVNLLNYTINQKDSKIEELKNELSIIIKKIEKNQKDSPKSKSVKCSVKQKKKQENRRNNSRRLSVSINWNTQEDDEKQLTVTHKKTSSFLITSKSNLFLNHLKSDVSENDERSNLNQPFSDEGKERKIAKKSAINYTIQPRAEMRKEMRRDEQKYTMAKSLLKLNKQESIITKFEKEKLDKEKKELLYFSGSRMRDLDLVRRTLTYRLKGFKMSFQHIQTEMLQRERHIIKLSQLEELLSEYPFSLQNRMRKFTMEYILRDCENQSYICCDMFCSRLRELIADFEQLDEQQQVAVIENIKKKIYMCQQGIMSECEQLSDRRGLMTEQNMHATLTQFKLSELQIGVIISQCCLLSSDADHLNYKHYLSIFQNDQ